MHGGFRWLRCQYVCSSKLAIPVDTVFGVCFHVVPARSDRLRGIRLCFSFCGEVSFCVYSMVINFCFSLCAIQKNLIRHNGQILQVDLLFAECSTQVPNCMFSLHFDVVHIYRQEKLRCAVDIETFPSWCLCQTFCLRGTSSLLSHSPCQWVTVEASVKEPLVRQWSPIVSVSDLVVVVSTLVGALSLSGDRSHLGASGICTCVQAGTASLASPALPTSLEFCSAKPALYPRSFFLTLSFLNTKPSCILRNVWQARSVFQMAER